jgi:hypothetical protein
MNGPGESEGNHRANLHVGHKRTDRRRGLRGLREVKAGLRETSVVRGLFTLIKDQQENDDYRQVRRAR